MPDQLEENFLRWLSVDKFTKLFIISSGIYYIFLNYILIVKTFPFVEFLVKNKKIICENFFFSNSNYMLARIT